MSYTHDGYDHFSGNFRPLDLLALTRLYGVNSEYRNEDNVYEFSYDAFTFIIDGAGTDIVNAEKSLENIYLDLRPGSHSYQGKKSENITDAPN